MKKKNAVAPTKSVETVVSHTRLFEELEPRLRKSYPDMSYLHVSQSMRRCWLVMHCGPNVELTRSELERVAPDVILPDMFLPTKEWINQHRPQEKRVNLSCYVCGYTVSVRESRVPDADYYLCHRRECSAAHDALPQLSDEWRYDEIPWICGSFVGYKIHRLTPEEIEFREMLRSKCEALLAKETFHDRLAENARSHPDVSDNYDLPLIRGYKGKYYCQADLLRRGWTLPLIGAVLGRPDACAINMHHMSGPKVKLWKIERVQEAEGGTTKQ